MIAIFGCKREGETGIAPAPSNHVVARLEEPSKLDVEGLIVHFPPARLSTIATGNGVTVDLSTPGDDPNGDRIDLTFTLEDVDDPSDLTGATWTYHTEDSERADTLNRILLREPYSVLEPVDVRVAFGREGERMTVEIEGQFRWYDPPDAEKPSRVVGVTGKLYAPLPKTR